MFHRILKNMVYSKKRTSTLLIQISVHFAKTKLLQKKSKLKEKMSKESLKNNPFPFDNLFLYIGKLNQLKNAKEKTYFGKIEFLIQEYSMNYAEKQNVFKN